MYCVAKYRKKTFVCSLCAVSHNLHIFGCAYDIAIIN